MNLETEGREACFSRRTGGDGKVLETVLLRDENGHFSLTVRRGDEEETLFCVSTNFAQARRLFRKISEGEVHPCHLSEIVEDLLCEAE